VTVPRETEQQENDAVSRETGAIARLATAMVLVPIRLYKRLISPLSGPRCRYYPTCSSYAEQAIRELGPLRGIIVAAWRVLRCNPWSSGGLDPLENRRLFRSNRGGSRTDHQPIR
jgi:putative membrane protein insertion efficiency factor